MATNVLSIVMRPGLLINIKPYSTFSYLLFYGQVGFDPDWHIKEFITVCNSNNIMTKLHWLEIFSNTFMDIARDWFNRQGGGTFATCAMLRDEFLTKCRPTAFNDRLRDQLHDLSMEPDKSIYSY